jgi:2-phosphosulfolactate phosphatase
VLVSHVTLDDAGRALGVVVVVDVLRAFTVGAFALAAGARAIRCVGTVEEALAVRDANPGSLAMGEHHHGRPVPGFDLGNSPTGLRGVDLAGRLLVHRSSAGTQGLVGAAPAARHLFAASFVCAGATAAAVRALEPDQVTFVATGVDHRDGDEDIACAEYIAALLEGGDVDAQPYLRRVRASDAAQPFLDGHPDFPAGDLDEAVRLDAVDFALRAEVVEGHPTLLAHRAPDNGRLRR